AADSAATTTARFFFLLREFPYVPSQIFPRFDFLSPFPIPRFGGAIIANRQIIPNSYPTKSSPARMPGGTSDPPHRYQRPHRMRQYSQVAQSPCTCRVSEDQSSPTASVFHRGTYCAKRSPRKGRIVAQA